MPEPEVTTDGRTWWVNFEGFCIGRFSPVLGEVLDPTLGLYGVKGEDFNSWVTRLKANWPEAEGLPFLGGKHALS